jgi:hypothetical protein
VEQYFTRTSVFARTRQRLCFSSLKHRRNTRFVKISRSSGAPVASALGRSGPFTTHSTKWGGRRPERHQRAKMVVVKTHLKGSRSWASLSGICRLSRGLVSIRRRGCFRFTPSTRRGEIVVAHKLTRSQLGLFFAEMPPCVVAMEACSSAHHWGETLIAFGHEVRSLPPAHVKPYVRRNKNDPLDAAQFARRGPDLNKPIQTRDPRGSCPGQRAATCGSKWMVLVFHCS